MRLVCLLLLFSFSCVESEIQKEYSDSEIVDSTSPLDISMEEEDFLTPKSKWVCHHPDTEFHNKECVENHYPKGCYVSGDNHKFCWLLLRDECGDSLDGNILEACKNVGYLN